MKNTPHTPLDINNAHFPAFFQHEAIEGLLGRCCEFCRIEEDLRQLDSAAIGVGLRRP